MGGICYRLDPVYCAAITTVARLHQTVSQDPKRFFPSSSLRIFPPAVLPNCILDGNGRIHSPSSSFDGWQMAMHPQMQFG